ncbi:MgtC/SapB family protein [Pseudanabaena mucicola]|uniref:MgtC/SapB family protein n=1 Tax=Pseudanabaena mucicola FACHB-723 TaxID=2692860 RepID=A0ABR7ZXZ1_9CYAN|nr:MgtC/SapB family protein [Pseudanabaena mucicola]MBD2188424.1 MgtC/SapB family protein [Pseudanabaena mucicola FACHB-723]
MPLAEFVIRLIAAFFLGSILGLERQWRQRISGLQTNATTTLVSTGACLFVLIAVMTPSDSSPTRITAQIVSGIGFLGGGVILRDGLTVRGLNTAATLWCAAAIGALTGAGFMLEAFAGTLTIVLANLMSRPLAHQNQLSAETNKNFKVHYLCHLTCNVNSEVPMRMLLMQAVNNTQLSLRSLSSKLLEDDPSVINVKAEILSEGKNDILIEKIIGCLIMEVGVFSINWQIIKEEP